MSAINDFYGELTSYRNRTNREREINEDLEKYKSLYDDFKALIDTYDNILEFIDSIGLTSEDLCVSRPKISDVRADDVNIKISPGENQPINKIIDLLKFYKELEQTEQNKKAQLRKDRSSGLYSKDLELYFDILQIHTNMKRQSSLDPLNQSAEEFLSLLSNYLSVDALKEMGHNSNDTDMFLDESSSYLSFKYSVAALWEKDYIEKIGNAIQNAKNSKGYHKKMRTLKKMYLNSPLFTNWYKDVEALNIFPNEESDLLVSMQKYFTESEKQKIEKIINKINKSWLWNLFHNHDIG